MAGIFSNCQKIKSLPDISYWELKNVVDINNISNGCWDLSSLPDIPKWNTSNINNMS